MLSRWSPGSSSEVNTSLSALLTPNLAHIFVLSALISRSEEITKPTGQTCDVSAL